MFDVISSGIIGWACGKLGDGILKGLTSNTNLNQRLNKVVSDWSRSLPKDHYFDPNTFFVKIEQKYTDQRLAYDNIQKDLRDNILPTQKKWHAAFMENWKWIKENVKDPQSFFGINESEASEELNKLSKMVYEACVQHESVFKSAVIADLDDIKSKLAEIRSDMYDKTRMDKSGEVTLSILLDRVINTYKLLGYKTGSVEIISEDLCSLFVEKRIAGGINVRLFVLCYNGNIGLSMDDSGIHEQYEILKNRGDAAGVIVVLNHKPFMKQRNDICCKGMTLLFIDELEEEILQIRPYLSSYISEYEKEPICKMYIPLRYTLGIDTCSTLNKVANANDLYSSMENWLENGGQIFSILGDYGSGKTTFMRHLTYCIAKKYVHNPSMTRIPIFIRLREYAGGFNAYQMIANHFVKDCGITINRDILERYIKAGRFLLLFDGFDELSNRSDAEARRMNFLEIGKLWSPLNKIVITCRPTHFVSRAELEDMAGQMYSALVPIESSDSLARISAKRDRQQVVDELKKHLQVKLVDVDHASKMRNANSIYVTLEPFSDKEIDMYLSNCNEKIKKAGFTCWQDIKDRIYQTYNLADLARRPILLDIIVETVPKLPKDRAIDPSILYETYTDFWMKRDDLKFHRLIKRHDRELFMQKLALQMLQENTLKIKYTDLSNEIKIHFSASTNEDMEYIATDVRTCSFLHRGEDEYYRFIHKSFMEYFAAAHYYKVILKDDWRDLSNTYLPAEVLLFLGHMLSKHENEKSHIRRQLNNLNDKVLDPQQSMFLSNILTLCSIIGEPVIKRSFKQLHCKGTLVRDIPLNKVHFINSILDGCKYQNTVSDQLEINSTQISQSELIKVRIKDVEFRDAVWANCSILESEIESGGIIESTFNHIEMNNVSFKHIVFLDHYFTNTSLEDVEFINCIFIGCSFIECGLSSKFVNCTGILNRRDGTISEMGVEINATLCSEDALHKAKESNYTNIIEMLKKYDTETKEEKLSQEKNLKEILDKMNKLNKEYNELLIELEKNKNGLQRVDEEKEAISVKEQTMEAELKTKQNELKVAKSELSASRKKSEEYELFNMSLNIIEDLNRSSFVSEKLINEFRSKNLPLNSDAVIKTKIVNGKWLIDDKKGNQKFNIFLKGNQLVVNNMPITQLDKFNMKKYEERKIEQQLRMERLENYIEQESRNLINIKNTLKTKKEEEKEAIKYTKGTEVKVEKKREAIALLKAEMSKIKDAIDVPNIVSMMDKARKTIDRDDIILYLTKIFRDDISKLKALLINRNSEEYLYKSLEQNYGEYEKLQNGRRA